MRISATALCAALAVFPASSHPAPDEPCADEGTITIGPPVACVEATFMLLSPHKGTGIPASAFEPPHNLDPGTIDPSLLDPNWCVHEILFSFALNPCSAQELVLSTDSSSGVVATPGEAAVFDTMQSSRRAPPGFQGTSHVALELADGTTVLRWQYQAP